MRILLVSAHGADPAYGGAERYLRNLAVGLLDRGHTVEVLSAFPQQADSDLRTHVLHDADWRDDRMRRLRNHVGDVVSAPWPRVDRALRQASPDLVHTNNLPGIGTGIWEAARRRGIPVVHTVHDYHLLCPRTSLTRRDNSPCRPHPLLCGARSRRMLRWHAAVAVLIGVSQHILRVHAGLFPGTTACVVRPPLAPLGARPQRPRTPPATIGYLGALTVTKGVELLLAAAPALVGHGLEIRVAGDGPLRPQVEAAADIRYDGRRSGAELARFLEACDAGVVPSLWDEPGPLVVGEWLVAGRPVLATRRGGLLEAAQRGGVALFDESADSLVQAALALRDPVQWNRLVATMPVVQGNADIERWLDEHEAAYESALETDPQTVRT